MHTHLTIRSPPGQGLPRDLSDLSPAEPRGGSQLHYHDPNRLVYYVSTLLSTATKISEPTKAKVSACVLCSAAYTPAVCKAI